MTTYIAQIRNGQRGGPEGILAVGANALGENVEIAYCGSTVTRDGLETDPAVESFYETDEAGYQAWLDERDHAGLSTEVED